MNFKKLLSFVISASIILCSFTTAFAVSAQTNYTSDDESDLPCGGPIEMINVKILYSPLSSRILIGDYEPNLEGIVLLITYPNGEKEILTVKEKDGLYCAGNFSAIIHFWYHENPPEYGFVNKTLSVYWDKNWGGYDGDADFIYLYLPAFREIPDIIHSYFTK
ncbi:MAG: hypothetical protein IJD88_02915 [Clostridia bacterium]|nr:hypothetical protein [Clostridia bacterium]